PQDVSGLYLTADESTAYYCTKGKLHLAEVMDPSTFVSRGEVTVGYDESIDAVTFSEGGRVLYFESDHSLFRAERVDDGSYGMATRLKELTGQPYADEAHGWLYVVVHDDLFSPVGAIHRFPLAGPFDGDPSPV